MKCIFSPLAFLVFREIRQLKLKMSGMHVTCTTICSIKCCHKWTEESTLEGSMATFATFRKWSPPAFTCKGLVFSEQPQKRHPVICRTRKNNNTVYLGSFLAF